MEERKYERCFYWFQPVDADVAEPQTSFLGNSQIPGASYYVSYRLIREACVPEPYPHRHEADEYLVFGTETMNGRDWDAEVAVTIGRGADAETFVINRPATVFIPAGTWHGPVDFRRVGKPVFYQPSLMQPGFGGVYALPEGEQEIRNMEQLPGLSGAFNQPEGPAGNAKKKYENLIFYKLPEHVEALVDGTPLAVTDDVEGIGMRGACQIAGSHAFINGGLVTEPVFMDPYPHKHDADEYLVFLGPPNDPGHFNAHVELTIGIGEDAELYSIDEPVIVRIPAGTWHCP